MKNLLFDWKNTVLWIIPVIFFSVMCFFLLDMMQAEITIVNKIIPFAYSVGTTVLAWHIYVNHHVRAKSRPFNLATLVFIPLTFGYVIFFEISFNTYRILEPEFLEAHLRYHIFNDIFVFIAIFFVMWVIFQKVNVERRTLLASYVLGVIFEAFFAGENGSGFGGAYIRASLDLDTSH